MNDHIPVRQLDPGQSSDRIYVRSVEGFYQRIRAISLWALMGMYFGFCWISINGQQMIHFDLPARQFHLFGTTFWPQDFYLLAFLLIICAFGLFFITTLVGRIWCGYTCPQTAWTFIFMWLEEKVEGSRNQRMKLDRKGFEAQRVRKKTIKHLLWLAVAFWTGLTFVGYFYPIRELVPDLFTLNLTQFWAWFWIGFFTLATYLNAGWMREKVCLYMCPYARFQSVMFDQDTLTVTYDSNRGEPRGSRKKGASKEETGLGDCIDCGICVQVCPTGIDIRDGLQYECINCGLCVDACDEVMERMDYDPGLIRYATEREIVEGRKSHWLKPRTLGYGVALIAMAVAVSLAIAARPEVTLDVSGDRGGLYQTGSGELIENSYNVRVSNRTDEARTFKLSVSGMDELRTLETHHIELAGGEDQRIPVVVQVPSSQIRQSTTPIEFQVVTKQEPVIRAQTTGTFIGPSSPGSGD